MKEDRIFTDEELKTIGCFFKVIFQAAKREGILSPTKEDDSKNSLQRKIG